VATPFNGGANPSYQWKVNGLNAGTNSDSFNSNLLNDNDEVSVAMTSSSLCANPNSATSNIIVMNVVQNLSPGVSIAVNQNPVCIGENVLFTATSINGGAQPSYQWKLNGNNAGSNSNTFTLSPNSGDVIRVEMSSSDPCASSAAVLSNSVTISVVSSLSPAVSITANATNICRGSVAVFTANPVNGGAAPAYQWKVDGLPAGANSPIFSTSTLNNGSHVSVEMTSSASCAVSPNATSNVITMTVGVAQTISISGLLNEYCIDATLQQLTGIPSGGVFNGPGVSGNSFVPFHAGAGTHQITYSKLDPSGCVATTSETIIVYDIPVVDFSNLDNSYCSLQQSVALAGTPAGGKFSGAGIDTSNSIFTVPASLLTTIYPITYTYNDPATNCTGSVTKLTTVYPVVTPTLVGFGKHYCENVNTVSLFADPQGGAFSGTGVINNVFFPNSAGTGSHTINYTYVDGNNCPNTATETIDVTQLPQVYLFGLDTAYCYNDAPVTLTGSPPGGTFIGVGVNGGTFSPNSGSPETTYTVEYTFTDSYQCTGTASQEVHLLSVPFVQLRSPKTIFNCNDQPVTLTVNIAGGDIAGPGIDGNKFDPNVAGEGSHLVTYSLTNANGCTGKDSLIMQVCLTGISELNNAWMRIYPNPGEGRIIIENLAGISGNLDLEVFSIEGKLLLERQVGHYGKGSRHHLDLSGFAEGMYFLKMTFGERMMAERLIIER